MTAADIAAWADQAVPALVLKIGQYPVQSGAVGVLRTLGRMGVPVYAVTEPGITPVAASRYCAGRFIWRATGAEDQDQLAADLIAAGREIGRPAVIIPVDDEAAVLVAEHAGDLADYFISPPVRPDLPRRLASKAGLDRLCAEHGVPAPAAVIPATAAQVAEFAASATFPVVVKNAGVWERRRRNPVGASVGASASGARVLHHPADLLALVKNDGQAPGFVVQELIPAEHAENWFAHLYAGASANCEVLFTGVKVRSWPVAAGVTACGVSVACPELADLARQFCKEIGFTGIADLDWVRDRRDGQFKLVDFNPRVGNQFRLLQTDGGIDVVRAAYLDLTGQPVPAGRQVDGRRIVVEHIDLPARLAYRRLRRQGQPIAGDGMAGLPDRTRTEFAWLAADDPLPAIAMLTRVLSLLKILRRGLRRNRQAAGTGRHSTTVVVAVSDLDASEMSP